MTENKKEDILEGIKKDIKCINTEIVKYEHASKVNNLNKGIKLYVLSNFDLKLKLLIESIEVRMKHLREELKNEGTHGKFKPLRNWKYDGNDVFVVEEIVTNGEKVNTHKDYRVGSKIYKDFSENLEKGHYKIKVIEY